MIHLRQVNGVKKKNQAFGVINIYINKICVNNAQYTGMCVSLDDWWLWGGGFDYLLGVTSVLGWDVIQLLRTEYTLVAGRVHLLLTLSLLFFLFPPSF